MVNITGVRFRRAGKIYYFDPEDLELQIGDRIIVETSRGIECGRIVMPPREVDEKEVVSPLKKIIRMATKEDKKRIAENLQKSKEAFYTCKQRIRKHQLDMKLIDAEYTFDHKKIMFYFTAEGRVDFRELIKDLASVFKTRIELRQIGVRDETKLMNGIGICGRPLCCANYLSDFAPVSIKMAKEQNLSLNPTKISGVCGRLMCCLKNEHETYEHLNEQLPGIGDTVEATGGIAGEVQQVNILRQTVRVLVEQGDAIEMTDFHVSELKILERHKKGKPRKKFDPRKNAEADHRKSGPQAEHSEAETGVNHADHTERGGHTNRAERTERGGHTNRAERGENFDATDGKMRQGARKENEAPQNEAKRERNRRRRERRQRNKEQ